MSSPLKWIVATSVAYIIITASAAHSADDINGTRKIGDGVYSFTLGEGNHSMFVVGEDNVAVFETFHSGHAQKLLAAVRTVTDKPVTHVFISHNHWDHASGGQVFSDAGAQTVMHRRAAEWIEANPGQDTALPDMIWSGSKQEYQTGRFHRQPALSGSQSRHGHDDLHHT